MRSRVFVLFETSQKLGEFWGRNPSFATDYFGNLTKMAKNDVKIDIDLAFFFQATGIAITTISEHICLVDTQ